MHIKLYENFILQYLLITVLLEYLHNTDSILFRVFSCFSVLYESRINISIATDIDITKLPISIPIQLLCDITSRLVAHYCNNYSDFVYCII